MTREEAIDLLDNLNGMIEDSCNSDYDTAFKMAIKALQPVTPKPKMGRWIEHFDESGKWYECDQCHTDWGGPVNYCPNCGAKM